MVMLPQAPSVAFWSRIADVPLTKLAINNWLAHSLNTLAVASQALTWELPLAPTVRTKEDFRAAVQSAEANGLQ
jgi:hypothetical protein